MPVRKDVIVMKLLFDAAVHAHPEAAVTVTVPLLAAAGTAAAVGARVKLQGVAESVPTMSGCMAQ